MQRNVIHQIIMGAAIALGAGCAGAPVDEDNHETLPPEAFLEDQGRLDEDTNETPRTANSIICGIVDAVQGISDAKATEFRVDPRGTSVTSSGLYGLFDTYNGSYLKWDVRTGVDLGWQSELHPNMKIERMGGGTIHYGDRVAIKFWGGHYLKHAHQTWGINLDFSDYPEYEWQVRGGSPGAAVPTGTRVRLYNADAGDNVVYCRRPIGINLAWAADCTDIPGLGRYRTGYCPF